MAVRGDVEVYVPSLMANLVVQVRATGTTRALWRLHLMRRLMVFAAWVGGVRRIEVDLSHTEANL